MHRIIFFSVFCFLISSTAWTQTDLPLPRFASLKSNEVNMRSGPGTQYPIKWVYNKKEMPVEIIAEFGNWRKVKDFEGSEGWILRNLLSGKRTALITQETIAYSLYEGENAVLRLGEMVQVLINKCRKSACEIVFDGTRGWVDKPNLWGVYIHEKFD